MDAKITQTIRECFDGTTMIVIAHRLATIMHLWVNEFYYELTVAIVCSYWMRERFRSTVSVKCGCDLQTGSPADLVADDKSSFYKLCMAQGQEEFDKLAGMVQ